MTSTDKTNSEEKSTMAIVKAESKKPVKAVTSLDPSLGDKFLSRFFKRPKVITVRTWVINDSIETAVEEKDVKIGSPDAELGSGKYNIDYNAVQNVFGKLVYNTKYRTANGALRYISQASHEVDAKIRDKMCARDNLTAIWSRWQLPLIIALVAIIGAVVGFTLFAIELSQASRSDACLHNESCMVQQIAKIRADAEAQKAKELAKANGGK